MKAVLDLCNEVCSALTDIERTGLRVNSIALGEIKSDYEKEKAALERDLNRMAKEVMGDKPYSLTSDVDRSSILFSRSMRDKKRWKTDFGIGDGNKYPRRMKKAEYDRFTRDNLRPLPKTKGRRCPTCQGRGKIAKKRKDGTYGAYRFNCPVCFKVGVEYVPSSKLAGFKLKKPPLKWVTVNGFSTSKYALAEYKDLTTNEDALEFMVKLARLSAVTSYLDTFVKGIQKRLIGEMVHPKFNQCVTKTGRLSSSKPNFQNMPRGGTFPVKRAIISRFEGGQILDVDFAQLEFRVAGWLAEDGQILQDVIDKIDVHTATANIIFGEHLGEGKHPRRQDSKEHTFKPLYGGTSGTEDEKRYYRSFLARYVDVAGKQEDWLDEAVTKRSVTIPSGRRYLFPNARRVKWGVTGATQIKNYPVQGFATADLLPISLVYLHKLLAGMESVICNTVHDSIIVDVHPDEIDEVVAKVKQAMNCLADETLRRFGVAYDMPVGFEIKIGPNWLEMEEVYETNGT